MLVSKQTKTELDLGMCSTCNRPGLIIKFESTPSITDIVFVWSRNGANKIKAFVKGLAAVSIFPGRGSMYSLDWSWGWWNWCILTK